MAKFSLKGAAAPNQGERYFFATCASRLPLVFFMLLAICGCESDEGTEAPPQMVLDISMLEQPEQGAGGSGGTGGGAAPSHPLWGGLVPWITYKGIQ